MRIVSTFLAFTLAGAVAACHTPVSSSGGGVLTTASTASVAAAPVVGAIAGRASIDGVALANAEVVVHDPLTNQTPARPGQGGGLHLEWDGASVHTGADGSFSLPLSLLPGQAAEVYVSDGKQSVCCVLVGPGASVRNAGKVAYDAATPLAIDTESTATAGVMLASLRALGQAAAKAESKGAPAILALQAKSLDAMASAAGPTAAKLLALAGTSDVAAKIGTLMVQADPRVPASFVVLDVANDEGAVLRAVYQALASLGKEVEQAIPGVLAEGSKAIASAVATALAGDDTAKDFAADLGAAIAQETTAATQQAATPVSPSAPTTKPDATPTSVPTQPPTHSSGGSGGGGSNTPAPVLSLQGVVKVGTDTEGKPRVAVSLTNGSGFNRQTVTDATGTYRFYDVPDGDYFVTFLVDGAQKTTKPVHIGDLPIIIGPFS